MQSRRVNVTRHGGPETLQLVEVDIPTPGPGQVRVRIEAAGVSYGDILLSRGVIPGSPKPPYTPGFSVAGVIEATGAGVDAGRVGEPVAALVRTGGYAEHIVLPAERLVTRPAEIGAVAAASVALNYFIAHQMLHRVARVRSGQQILVHGASGGVGLAFVQLAALAAVTCFGSASAAKLELVARYGAQPLDYRSHDFVEVIRASPGGAVDAVFDPIGGRHFNRSYSVLRHGGIMVGYGQSAAVAANGTPDRALGARGFLGGIVLPKLVPDGRRTVFYNAWSLEKKEPQAYAQDLRKVLELLAGRRIEPVLATTVPLAEAARAQQRLQDREVTGTLVLTTS
jgi:NADPH:quinone reductase-like Zn-dependent oxidoreductase